MGIERTDRRKIVWMNRPDTKLWRTGNCWKDIRSETDYVPNGSFGRFQTSFWNVFVCKSCGGTEKRNLSLSPGSTWTGSIWRQGRFWRRTDTGTLWTEICSRSDGFVCVECFAVPDRVEICSYDQEGMDELLGFMPGPSAEREYECVVYAAPVGKRK